MLRTLHVNTERTWRGGEGQTLHLVRGLAAHGHEADLVCPPGSPLETRAREAGVRVVALAMRGEADLGAVWRLRRMLKRGAYDLVHAHTSHAHTLAVLAAAGTGVRVVISRRVDFSIFRRSFLGLNRFKYNHGFDILLTVSDAIRDVLIRDGVNPRLLRTVRSGIDPARFPEEDRRAALPADLGVPAGARLIVNTAHLTPHKGQIHLVRAFPEVLRRTPAAFLLIVGQGELREELASEIECLGIAHRTALPGFRADIGAILAHTEVFVMPSVEEGLGTAVLDAFLFGLPVVGSHAGGIPEMITDGVNGLLVPPADPAALAAAVTRLLEDGALRARLGAEALRTVMERFTCDRTVRETIEVYEELMARPRGAPPPPTGATRDTAL